VLVIMLVLGNLHFEIVEVVLSTQHTLKKSMSNFTFGVPLDLFALSDWTSVWKIFPLIIAFCFSFKSLKFFLNL
jgi:hypothetical protein